MSDPQPDKLRPRPPRAEPVQPDRPGRGTDTLPADEADTTAREERERSAKQQKEQSDAAIQNTSEGYD